METLEDLIAEHGLVGEAATRLARAITENGYAKLSPEFRVLTRVGLRVVREQAATSEEHARRLARAPLDRPNVKRTVQSRLTRSTIWKDVK